MRKSVGRANVATVFFEKLLVLLEVFEKLKSFFACVSFYFLKNKCVNFFKKILIYLWCGKSQVSLFV